jgi:carbamoyltransferase
MIILGLSAPNHDASAALVSARGLEAAVEESKLVRSRAFSGVPCLAAQSCLDQTSLSWPDISIVAIAGQRRLSRLRQAWLQTTSNPLGLLRNAFSHAKEICRAGPESSSKRFLQGRLSSSTAVVCFEHQLCHAASAFYGSPFDRALILTLDERGDGLAGTMSIGEGSRIRILQTIAFPHSIGRVYSQVTRLLGFLPRSEEQKTQWLSLQGEPVFENTFVDMLSGSSNGSFRLDLTYFNRHSSNETQFSEKFYGRIGLAPAKWPKARDEIGPHLACSLQQACATVLTRLLQKWRKQLGARNLCLAGGVFLNALLVGDLEKSSGFEEIFVQPASGNAGCSLGAAWLAWHQTLGNPRLDGLSNVYLGPSFKPGQIKEVLDNCKAPYRWFRTDEERNEETVRLLEAGKIVAWCQGATEFGPRALGNRSLLASPWAPFVKENLNDYIKHREHFRPFALAVPAEDQAQFFDCTRQAAFMTSVGWAKPGAQELAREFLLPRNRVRLHVVNRESNPSFWTLLKKFGERSPAPFLINASFNMFGEPLVNSPRDAVRSFYCSGVDALVIGGFLLCKK